MNDAFVVNTGQILILVQNVQPLRSVQPPRRAAPFKTF
jgi:hypothetical protein